MISIPELWFYLRRRKVLFSLVFLGVNLLCIGVYTALSPIYQASALLLMSREQAGLLEPQASKKPPPHLTEEALHAQAEIIASEEVLRRTIRSVRLYSKLTESSFPQWLAVLFGRNASVERPAASDDATYDDFIAVKKALSVGVEPKTNLLRIYFRHNDPRAAAAFVNTLSQSYIQRYIELYKQPSSVTFYNEQKQKYERAFAEAAETFHSFAVEKRAYSIEEQRRLGLTRRSSLAAALDDNRTSIAEQRARLAALTGQLSQMKAVALSSSVGGLVTDMGRSANAAPAPDTDKIPALAKDPPLLLIRAYQELMTELVKANSELAGLRAAEVQRQADLTRVDGELATLSASEAEFTRLQNEVQLARASAKVYSDKVAEDKLNSDLSGESISEIQIAQAATIPTKPVFPRLTSFVVAGLAMGTLIALAVVIFLGQADIVRERSKTAAADPFKTEAEEPDTRERASGLSYAAPRWAARTAEKRI